MEPIPKRSPESVSFEAVWRSLPRGGGIPSRDVFQPRLAKPFLPNLILLTVPRADDPTLRVRLVGDHIVRQIGRDIVGDDYLEFLGRERRDGALAVLREMFEKPCGAWWVAVVHYERGFSQYWEMTVFPLAGKPSPSFVLGFVQPTDITLDRESRQLAPIHVAAPVVFQTIAIN